MSVPVLGRLEKVELRNAWQSESGDFTPWLAQGENLKLLGEAINLDLELEAQVKVAPATSVSLQSHSALS